MFHPPSFQRGIAAAEHKNLAFIRRVFGDQTQRMRTKYHKYLVYKEIVAWCLAVKNYFSKRNVVVKKNSKPNDSIEKIIGRVREQDLLKDLISSKKSEFIAVYGRRMVGKTYLIKNFSGSLP